MALQASKTTIQIDPEILYQAKLKALKDGKTLKQLIEDSLMVTIKTKPADDQRKQELKRLARETVGSLKNTQHPEWKDVSSIIQWQKELRTQWN